MGVLSRRIGGKMAWRVSSAGLMKRSRKAFSEWLSLPEWDWYCTHTFKADYVSPKQADREWYSWFNSLRMCAKAEGLTPSCYGPAAPYYFRVTEVQPGRGTIHFHSLIGNCGNIRRLSFKDLWELEGFARVSKYNPSMGAAGYVSKYLTKSDGDIRFSHNLAAHLSGDAKVT